MVTVSVGVNVCGGKKLSIKIRCHNEDDFVLRTISPHAPCLLQGVINVSLKFCSIDLFFVPLACLLIFDIAEAFLVEVDLANVVKQRNNSDCFRRITVLQSGVCQPLFKQAYTFREC